MIDVIAGLLFEDEEQRKATLALLEKLGQIDGKGPRPFGKFCEKYGLKAYSAEHAILHRLAELGVVRLFFLKRGDKKRIMIEYSSKNLYAWALKYLSDERAKTFERLRRLLSEQSYYCPVCRKAYSFDEAADKGFKCCAGMFPLNGDYVIAELSKLEQTIELIEQLRERLLKEGR